MKLYMLLFLLVSSVASADFITGNELNNLGNDTDVAFNRGLFSGYVVAVSDLGDGVLFCLPHKATPNQLGAVVKKYLEQNPEKWNKDASKLVINSLIKSFPCAK